MIVLATSNLNRVAGSPTTMRFRFCLSHPLGVRQDRARHEPDLSDRRADSLALDLAGE